MSYKKMNADLKQQWIDALRSKQYKQGKKVLCQVDEKGKESFCCLGVLFDIAGGEVDGEWSEVKSGNFFCSNIRSAKVKSAKSSNEEFLPKGFIKFSGVEREAQSKLAEMNDYGHSFKEIADWIEENL